MADIFLKTWGLGMGLIISALGVAISIAVFNVPDYYMVFYIVLTVLGLTIGSVIPIIIWKEVY